MIGLRAVVLGMPARLKGTVWALVRAILPAFYCYLYNSARLRDSPHVSMRLVPDDIISDAIARTGFYEEDLTQLIVQARREGGLFVDVGANLGYFTLLWAGASKMNRVVAFEASPRNVDILLYNIRRNGFEDRVQLEPHAAGREAGVLSFDVGPVGQTGWGGFSLHPGKESISVEVVRIDDVIKEPIRLLKVDVEGADPWVLMGCERLLRSRLVEEVWFEENKERSALLGIGPMEGARFLESVGYDAAPMNDPTGELVNWRAIPKTPS